MKIDAKIKAAIKNAPSVDRQGSCLVVLHDKIKDDLFRAVCTNEPTAEIRDILDALDVIYQAHQNITGGGLLMTCAADIEISKGENCWPELLRSVIRILLSKHNSKEMGSQKAFWRLFDLVIEIGETIKDKKWKKDAIDERVKRLQAVK